MKKTNYFAKFILYLALIMSCGFSYGTRTKLFFNIIITIIAVAILFYIIYFSNKFGKYKKIIYTGLIITRLLSPFILSLKISSLIFTIYYFYSLFDFIIIFTKSRNEVGYFALIFSYCLMQVGVETNIINTISGLPMILGIIISVICIIIFIYLYLKNNKKDKKKKSMIFSISILLLLLGISINNNSIISINHSLNTSEKVVIKYEIMNKEEIPGVGRTPRTNYYLILKDFDHPLSRVKVNNITYKNYEIGDYIEISFCDGALGISYFYYEQYK